MPIEDEVYERSIYVTTEEFNKIFDALERLKKERTRKVDATLNVILVTLGMQVEGGIEYTEKWGRG